LADYESSTDELIIRFVCRKLLIDKFYQNNAVQQGERENFACIASTYDVADFIAMG
jgi:hypothetical protein